MTPNEELNVGGFHLPHLSVPRVGKSLTGVIASHDRRLHLPGITGISVKIENHNHDRNHTYPTHASHAGDVAAVSACHPLHL